MNPFIWKSLNLPLIVSRGIHVPSPSSLVFVRCSFFSQSDSSTCVPSTSLSSPVLGFVHHSLCLLCRHSLTLGCVLSSSPWRFLSLFQTIETFPWFHLSPAFSNLSFPHTIQIIKDRSCTISAHSRLPWPPSLTEIVLLNVTKDPPLLNATCISSLCLNGLLSLQYFILSFLTSSQKLYSLGLCDSGSFFSP